MKNFPFYFKQFHVYLSFTFLLLLSLFAACTERLPEYSRPYTERFGLADSHNVNLSITVYFKTKESMKKLDHTKDRVHYALALLFRANTQKALQAKSDYGLSNTIANVFRQVLKDDTIFVNIDKMEYSGGNS